MEKIVNDAWLDVLNDLADKYPEKINSKVFGELCFFYTTPAEINFYWKVLKNAES